MSKSRKVLTEALRAEYLFKLIEFFHCEGEEVLRTASNEIAFPCVDAEGNDEFIVVKVTVPAGSRDGEAYDAYGVAEDYRIHTEEMAERKAKAEKAKAEKIARDQKMREEKAKARAEAEAKKKEASGK